MGAHDQGAGDGVDLDDPARLAAARRLQAGVLGNEVLERLSRLAARLLGVGSAQVSLLTEVQTVASGTGLGAVTPGQASTSREDSLCTVTARGNGPLLVVEAAQDARVLDLPPVTSGAVGSYLGVPLADAEGHVVGAFCVYDREPRSWSALDVETLAELAAAATAELERAAVESERDLARLQFGLAIESGGIGSWDWDLAAGTMVANAPLLRMFGLPRELEHLPVPAKRFVERVHRGDRDRVAASVEQALSTGGEYADEYRIVHPDGQQRWVVARGRPMREVDGSASRLVGAAYDTTDSHVAADVARDESALMALIARASDLLASSLEAEEAVRSFARLVVPVLADWSVVSLVGEDGVLADVDWWHRDPDKREVTGVFARHRLEGRTEAQGSLGALRSGEPFVKNTGALDYAMTTLRSGRAVEAVRALDLSAVCVHPLIAEDRVIGLITLARDSTRPPFTPAEVQAASDLSRRAARTLTTVRTFSREREISEQLQRSMLTDPVVPDGVEVAVRYLPASTAAQVGGDWYDAFAQHDGATVLVVGDVVGHDTAAATVMGQLRSILRGIAVAGGGPAAVLRDLDRAIDTLRMPTPASVVVARLEHDPDGGPGRITWSNAGHPPPIMVDDHGRAQALDLHDAILGVAEGLERGEESRVLVGRHTVLMYTDGLVERRGEDIDVGIDRLVEVAASLDGLPLEELVDRVLERMLPGAPEDDVVLLALRRT